VVAGSPGAVAAGEAAALDRLQLRVDGGTLVVGHGAGGFAPRPGEALRLPRLRISALSLRGVLLNGGARVRIAEMRAARVDLALNGGGSLDVAAIRADNLNATLTGTGAMTIGGTAGEARVRSYGAGSIDAGRLVAGDATLISESSGDIRMEVRYSARIIAMGAGSVSVTGKPECRISGSGPVECGGTVRR
jgi:hypothetical protein